MSVNEWLRVLVVGMSLGVGTALAADPPTIEVFKLPDCGCCKAWIKYLQASGFAVKTTDVADVAAKKAVQDRFSVPEHLRSCHTAVIEGYVIEGHVAAEEIQHLLDQRPKWKGLFVKDMPKGAPGMEGGEGEAYDVIAVDENGKESVYAHHGPWSGGAEP
jgi:hypothetical protein